jgi:hypothetical protein
VIKGSLISTGLSTGRRASEPGTDGVAIGNSSLILFASGRALELVRSSYRPVGEFAGK